MNLVELLEKRAFEKTAEQVFIEAFEDELMKLGWSEELVKQSGIATKIVTKAKGALGAIGKIFAKKQKKGGLGSWTYKPKPKSQRLKGFAKTQVSALRKASPDRPFLPGEAKDVLKSERARGVIGHT
jgi:hypothetical protein